MIRLYRNFQAYLQLNLPRIKYVLIFGILFLGLYQCAQKNGYTKKCKNIGMRIIRDGLLSLSCAFIFVMTLFGRTIGQERNFEFIPFKSYSNIWVGGNMEILLQILMNIVMYIPLGFLLPCSFKLFEKYRYIILVTVISSVSIELIQAIFKIGLFEVDDIINNTLGAFIGMVIYAVFSKLKKRRIGNWKNHVRNNQENAEKTIQ